MKTNSRLEVSFNLASQVCFPKINEQFCSLHNVSSKVRKVFFDTRKKSFQKSVTKSLTQRLFNKANASINENPLKKRLKKAIESCVSFKKNFANKKKFKTN